MLLAQPRVSVWARGLDRPVAILPVVDGRVLVVQENGLVFEFDSRGVRAPEPWFRVWEGRVPHRVVGAIILREAPELQVALYLAHVDGEGKSTGRLSILREVVDGSGVASRLWAGTLLEELPGAETRMGGGMAVRNNDLFLGTGNAGEDSLSQDDASLGGKILRFSLADGPLGPSRPEVWAKGFHSVHGLTFLPGFDLLFAADLGPRPPLARNWDEINLVQKGRNYGYPEVFGGRATSDFQAPIVHSTGVRLWDPAGLTALGSGPWANSLVWTGLESQSLYRITLDPREPTKILFFEQLLTRAHGRLRAIATYQNTQLLVGTWNAGPDSPNSDYILWVQPR